MKILWIVNTVFGAMSEHLYRKKSNGAWMDALLHSFKNRKECQLIVVTTVASKKMIMIEEEGIKYYALPGQPPILYKENRKKNIRVWKQLIDEEQPDLIQIWGTEFTHGLCALRVIENIPSVIYMQGYLGSIARHYLGAIPYKELKRTITLRDIVKHDGVLQQQKRYYLSAVKEKEMLQLSGNIISENEWCNSSVRALVPEVQVYSCPLSINQIFSTVKWDIDTIEKHSLICTASGYPLKGLHMVLRTIAMLKVRYPDIKLYVPGTKMVSDGSVQWLIRKRGYTKYIEKLIKELGIAEQIIWLGHISQEELANYYKKTHVFVLSSAIENHSSSLKEAMMVGTPSVASAVGGVAEYIKHGQNAFLYRYEEYEIMASYIAQIFEDDKLAVQLSTSGRKDMLDLHGESDIYEKMIRIYRQIIKERE